MSVISQNEPKNLALLHNLELKERKKLTVSGVTGVPTFTAHSAIVSLEKVTLNVTGTNLKVEALDLDKGTLTLTGEVSALKYTTAVSPTGLIKQIFK